MGRSFSSHKPVAALRNSAGALAVLAALTVIPQAASATETDRLTVEDPVTSAVKFRLTSEGNVTGGIFTGDGSGLTNVAHFKGAWSNATAYLKDDCVSYNGATYIALAPSTAVQPDITPASWAVMAAKGAQGDKGDKGDQGIQGIQGVQGIQGIPGTDGSPDTQAQILTKIATQADGAVLAVQQSANDTASTVKLAVKDAGSNNTFQVTAGGNVVVGATTPNSTLHVKGQAAIPGTGTVSVSNNGNTVTGVGTAFTSQLHIGDAITAAGQTQVVMTIVSDTLCTVGAVFSPAISGASFTYTPQQIVKVSDNTSTDKMVVTGGGFVGIGTNTPGHSLDVVSSSGPVAQFINTVGGTSGAGFVAISDPGRAVTSGERLGYILLGGAKDSAHSMSNSSGIAGFATENWSSTAAGANLQFLTTTAGGTSRTEKMRIEHNGNVGIATNTPQQKLEVNGGIRIYSATPPTKPDCSDANPDAATKVRGTFWYTQGTTGDDMVEVCAKVSGSYAWKKLLW